MSVIDRKRGALSTEEQDYIRANVSSKSVEDMANSLNRTEAPIKAFCQKNSLMYKGMDEDVYDELVLTKELEEKPFWKVIKEQFTKEELSYFISTWVNMMKQCKANVEFSEELQVKQWITLDILGNRNLKDRKKALEQLDYVENIINTKYSQQNILDLDPEEQQRVIELEQEVAVLRGSIGSYIGDHVKILKEIQDTQKHLKLSRSDRITKIDDSKSSFVGLLKALDDEVIRQKAGEEIEIMRLAKDRAKAELSKLHQFDDGCIDHPLTLPEMVLDDDT